jgi:membrane protein
MSSTSAQLPVTERVQQRLKPVLESRPAMFVQKFLDDRALSLASLLAWGMLNTFLPLLLGVLALVGLVLGDSAGAIAAEEQILAMLPPSVSELVRQILQSVERSATAAGLISLGLLLFTGSNFFVTLESVFDLAYHVPDRNPVTQRIVSLAALFVVAGLLLVASTASVLGSALGQEVRTLVPRLADVIDTGVGSLISTAGLVSITVLMYWLIPNTKHSLRRALPGAIVASILLFLAVRIFPIYVALFGGGFNVYAAFGSVLLFMFWLYIVGVVLVGGAVLNSFLEDPRGSAARSTFAEQARTGRAPVPPAYLKQSGSSGEYDQ